MLLCRLLSVALLCFVATAHQLSCSDMKSLVSKFFSKDHQDIMLCIAYHESSYEPKARNPSGATGLFQIMPSHCGEPGCPARDRCVEDLMDATKNAKCAKSVLHSQGFNAWTTYSMCHGGGGPCQIHDENEHIPNPEFEALVKVIGSPYHSNRTRAQVMECVHKWVADEVPYCQCPVGSAECCGDCKYCDTYRCDCSGYVSACYNLDHAHNTATLTNEFHRIEHKDLKEGDIMLWPGDPPEGHVVIFGEWTDKDMSHYTVYQEPGCHNDGPHHAYKSTVPYPMSWTPPDGGSFKPYRYNHLSD